MRMILIISSVKNDRHLQPKQSFCTEKVTKSQLVASQCVSFSSHKDILRYIPNESLFHKFLIYVYDKLTYILWHVNSAKCLIIL